MMNKIKKGMHMLLNLISILIVVLSVLLMLSVVFTGKGEIPDIMGYRLLRVLTGSMEPNVPVNSLILVKRTDAADLKAGDVISFYSKDPELDGMANTHRISRIEKENGSRIIYTKGDANSVEDLYATDEDHIIGKVVGVSHWLGILVRLAANPLVFIPLILAPLVMILGYHIWQVVHTTRELSRAQEDAYLDALEKIKENRKKRKEQQPGQESQGTDQDH